MHYGLRSDVADFRKCVRPLLWIQVPNFYIGE